MDKREYLLNERWNAAMERYRSAQAQVSRDYLLRPDGVPTRETMQKANAARSEVVSVRRLVECNPPRPPRARWDRRSVARRAPDRRHDHLPPHPPPVRRAGMGLQPVPGA